MMLRQIALAILALASMPWATSCLIADEPEVAQKQAQKILAKEAVVPEGVTYKKATADENRRAIEKLSKAFLAANANDNLPEELFPGVTICGTGMWRNIKNDAEMKKIEAGQVTINVPTEKGKQELEGKLFQNKDELAAFWRAFRRHYKLDPKATIRRPTSEELSLYWAMIPYDITEPIFMIESNDTVILAHFTTKDLTIAWIDDFKNMRVEKAK